MDDGDRHHDSLYNIRLGMRYHMRRQAFFERCHRAVGIASLVGGSASVAALAGQNSIAALYASALIAVAQAFDLIIDTRHQAELHNKLRQRYCLLEPEILDRAALSETEYKDVQSKIKQIEVDEPPPKYTLLGMCQDELNDVLKYSPEEAPASYSQHGWFKRLTAQIW